MGTNFLVREVIILWGLWTTPLVPPSQDIGNACGQWIQKAQHKGTQTSSVRKDTTDASNWPRWRPKKIIVDTEKSQGHDKWGNDYTAHGGNLH
jgi:hypothetical protein